MPIIIPFTLLASVICPSKSKSTRTAISSGTMNILSSPVPTTSRTYTVPPVSQQEDSSDEFMPSFSSIKSPVIEEKVNTSKPMPTVMQHSNLVQSGDKAHVNSIVGGTVGGILFALLAVGIIILHLLLVLYLYLKKMYHKNENEKEAHCTSNDFYVLSK